ncbi:MAG: hypothetical protein IJU86_01635, partial [Firmicutes bacterium]|nr:hypothetical protein [Bacillota bacterium]
MKEHDNDYEKNILEMNDEQSENKIKNLKDDIIFQEAYEQSENKATNLKDDLNFWETKLDKNTLQGNVNNVLENVIRNVKYENLDPNDKGQNSKALKTYLKVKKIDIKDFLVALQNSSCPLKKKLRLYMLLVSKNDRKFLDMYRLMKNDNFHVEELYNLDDAIYTGESEVRNFTHYDQY